MQEYLKSHWNGQLPLWKSFWLSVVTATLLFAFLAAAFYSLSTVVGMLFTALAIPAWIWSHVGLWRCVEQRPGYWALVAKLYCGSYGLLAIYYAATLVLMLLGLLLDSPFKQTQV